MTNLIQRAITGIAVVIVIGALVLLSRYTFIFLVIILNLLGLLEFYRLFHSYTRGPRNIIGVLLSLSIIVIINLVISGAGNWQLIFISLPLGFSLFIIELFMHSEYPFQNLAIIYLGVICVTVPLCFFCATAFLPPGTGNYDPQLVLGYFFLLWSDDTGAYFIGKLFGKRKLFQRVSPNKTWEGSAGGASCALIVAYVNSYFFTSINVMSWVILAIIIIITGTFGDLIKSLLKRSLGLKDSGTILPGHGGIFDRFDSLLGSSPFVFCYLILSWHA